MAGGTLQLCLRGTFVVVVADSYPLRCIATFQAKKYHPDVNTEDPKAKDKFAEVARSQPAAINSAYEILGDAEKRKMYDQGMMDQDGNEAGFGGGFGGFQGGFQVSRLCCSLILTRARNGKGAANLLMHTDVRAETGRPGCSGRHFRGAGEHVWRRASGLRTLRLLASSHLYNR
eukprot:1598047-Rhodomonas_salina.1